MTLSTPALTGPESGAGWLQNPDRRRSPELILHGLDRVFCRDVHAGINVSRLRCCLGSGQAGLYAEMP